MTPESRNETAASLPVGRAKPELLAPAGDQICMRAAVENGADAVYFGLDCGFNARARAHNLDPADLASVMEFLHSRGVCGYVTLNTLAFTDELETLRELICTITDADVDAVLVQDLGLVRLIRSVSPDLPVHASTQMTLTSAECIRAVEELGVERVVLARELSIAEVRAIHEQTSMELEAFVHGALCVAYSGQCLTSESLGGRSANRGQCAQACRLPYDVICDDEDVNLGDVKYILSPQDLAAYALISDLIDAGIRSFKIEGRLKSPEYVANITQHYRKAIDLAIAGRAVEFSKPEVRDMELSFSRGFSPGWLNGCDHKMLVPGLSSAKQGILLARVKRVARNGVVVKLLEEVARGDGVVFEGDRAAEGEQGGRIYEILRGGAACGSAPGGAEVELRFERIAIDFSQLSVGQAIRKTDDPQLTARLRKTFRGPHPQRKLALDLTVKAHAGSRLEVQGRAEHGAHCTIASAEPLEVATKHTVSESLLTKQLGRLGNTPFELRQLTADIEGGPMVPLSVLGQIRAQLVEQLVTASVARPKRRLCRDVEIGQHSETNAKNDTAIELRVLCRSLQQVTGALECDAHQILADFQDIREYRQAVELAHAHGAHIMLATPRIQKPGEMGIFSAMSKHGADGLLVRNLAGLRFCAERGIVCDADFSLNAANPITVQLLCELGARRVAASYDLNREQLLDLVVEVPPRRLEVVIHQHMPMFHMEHCVFCAVLSPGTDKTNCGRPCDVHQVRIRDRIGMEHPLKADVGCRNTVFNAIPQSAAEAVPDLLKLGVSTFRIELPVDDDRSPHETIELYRRLLRGEVSGRDVWRQLNAANRLGVTRGTLEERRNPLAIL